MMIPLEDLAFEYEISEDMMPVREKGLGRSAKDGKMIEMGTLWKPGFLRCIVKVKYDGRIYTGMVTAAFDKENIVPETKFPDDFQVYWNDIVGRSFKIANGYKNGALARGDVQIKLMFIELIYRTILKKPVYTAYYVYRWQKENIRRFYGSPEQEFVHIKVM